MRHKINALFWHSIFILLTIGIGCAPASRPESQLHPLENAFPLSIEFSPVPDGNGWKDEKPPLSADIRRQTLQNITGHGFSALLISDISSEQTKHLLKDADSLGIKIVYLTGGFELFDRDHTPAISVYSPEYAKAVRKKIQAELSYMKDSTKTQYLFAYQDEPFHSSPKIFDYSAEAKAEFYKRYGYSMPPDASSVRNDPKKWLDLLNFQSGTFADGWRQVYQILKEFDSRPKIIMTHDSHNTFGAGVKSHSQVAIDDVFHWKGDFADVFVYDIYPYTMYDYRFGDFGQLPKPRFSQLHYTISQLRNLTTTYGKELGFWVGTYNKLWFGEFMSPEWKAQYWTERELAFTAIAQGANFIQTGAPVPEDAKHWKDFGEAMTVIQKAGPGLLKAPKVKANACFLFPRTQYLQLQEEYFNAGLTFELFLRTFGELDIIHEDQITDDNLNGYKILVMADVKLLPQATAKHIEEFVKKGGMVIADCVPQSDEYNRPSDDLKKLFGVSNSSTNRIGREGHWVPFTTKPPKMAFPRPANQPIPPIKTDEIAGRAFDSIYNFKIVSPRQTDLLNGKSLLQLKSGTPALIRQQTGQGKTYLFGFCLQDTYFQTYKDSNDAARRQLLQLVRKVLDETGIPPHIYSLNPDIEATVRAGSGEGYVFIINHEATQPTTTIRITDIGFSVGKVVNIEDGQEINFKKNGNAIELEITVPFGSTRLFKLQP